MVTSYRSDDYTLDDFRRELANAIAAPGLLHWLPQRASGVATLPATGEKQQAELRQIMGVIDAMTQAERNRPAALIDINRAWRIAAGAGVPTALVVDLVLQFKAFCDFKQQLKRTGPNRPR